MTRPRRILYPGAIYHVTSRGNRRADIYLDRRDHLIWLDLLAQTASRFRFKVFAYCMMPNHFHVTVETVEANLSQGMHFLNSRFAQHFNTRHGLVGHVIQGRFHAVLVNEYAHLFELTRYVPLNPVRTPLVRAPADWEWSSYRAHAGLLPAPEWLQTDAILNQFAGDLTEQRAAFVAFVQAGRDMPNPLAGADEFTSLCGGVPMSLADYAKLYPDRATAMAAAYFTNGYTMAEIAGYFGVSTKTVSRAAKRHVALPTAEPVSDFGVEGKCLHAFPALQAQSDALRNPCDAPVVDTSPSVEESTSVGITARKIV